MWTGGGRQQAKNEFYIPDAQKIFSNVAQTGVLRVSFVKIRADS
jgi:hypothetical protein